MCFSCGSLELVLGQNVKRNCIFLDILSIQIQSSSDIQKTCPDLLFGSLIKVSDIWKLRHSRNIFSMSDSITKYSTVEIPLSISKCEGGFCKTALKIHIFYINSVRRINQRIWNFVVKFRLENALLRCYHPLKHIRNQNSKNHI